MTASVESDILTSFDAGTRRLCRFDDGEPFAYVRHAHDFYRVRDHMLWAQEIDDLLVSSRSGAPLARRQGAVYYDAETGLPLFYERTL